MRFRDHLLYYLAAYLANLALKVSDASLARVITDDLVDHIGWDANLVFFQSIGLNLFRNQVTLSNIGLFLFGIAFEANHFHPVEQGPWNIKGIGGRNKHGIRQVDVNFQVMIIK